jgi:polygalacturonase
MNKYCLRRLGCLLLFPCVLDPAGFLDVRDYGAKGDGTASDTAAFQAAVDGAEKVGGAVVGVPPGIYRCGTIHLKSNIEIHLAPGSVLQMSPDEKDFDPYEKLPYDSHADVETSDFRHALLAGENVHDVAITGQGTIDGNRTRRGGPKPIALKNAEHIAVRGISIRNAPNYAISFVGCDYVDVDGVTIRHGYADGIDPDCSRFVRIANCFVETWDDAICPKASLALGRRRSTEHVAVTNCVLTSSSNHIKLGTETSGDLKDIVVSNCTMFGRTEKASGDYSGIAIESADGSHVDGVVMSNIAMRDVRYVLFIRLENRARGMPVPKPGSLENVSLSNLVATGVTAASSITGLAGAPVRRISLDNVRITAAGGERDSPDLRVPEAPAAYPEANMFGALPAYGLYVRHAVGLTLRNIQVRWEQPDLLSALVFDDVKELDLDGFVAETAAGDRPAVWMNEVRGALVRGCRLGSPAAAFLRLTGAGSTGISLTANDLTAANRPFILGPEVPSSALRGMANILRTARKP